MKKFQYRLESLLKVKAHIEKEKQKAHAGSMKKVLDQQLALTEIEIKRLRAFDQQRQRAAKHFSVAEMLVISRYAQKLRRDDALGGEFLKALEKEADQTRTDLVEASRERKKYDKLKDKLREKHHKEVNAAMVKENDETAINSFRIKKKSRSENSG